MHTKIKRGIFLVLAVAMLATAGGMLGPLHRQRVKYRLSSTPVEGVSPELAAATQALGAFRGIMLDLVWIRLRHLKQQGRFFEMVQLSDWACKLAPHFTKIWQFHAWNLAFNVSVEVPSYSDRWSWVKSGIEVLRDEAIPINPHDPELYSELARLYLVKVAGRKDDAHMLYKSQLGVNMHMVLGGEGTPDKLQKLAATPDSKSKMMEESGVEEFRKECRNHKFDPLSVKDMFRYLNNPDSVKEEVRKLLDSGARRDVVQKIITFVRTRRLQNDYKLKPQKMLDIMKEYAGEDREYLPFDWRSPYPHVIYWGTIALEKAKELKQSILERRKEFGVDPEELAENLQKRPEWVYRDIDYDRLIYSGFKGLVRHGRLVFNANGQLLPVLGPNYEYADTMLQIYRKLLDKYGQGMFADTIRSSRANFLNKMSVEFYLMGNRAKAVEYWTRLVKNYATEKYDEDFGSYIDNAVDQWIENMNQTDARRMVRGLLTRSFLYWGSEQDTRAAQLQEKARSLTKRWNQDAETDRWRIPYKDIRDQVLIDIFSGRIKMSEPIMNNLKAHLGKNKVQKYQEAAEKRHERVSPGVTGGRAPQEQ